MALRDQFQSLGAAVGRNYRGVRRTLVSGATSLTGFSAYIPKHLAYAMHDIRSSDPRMAREFYNGRYLLAGKMIETLGKSPFLVEDAPSAWIEKLHAFNWLRHFSNSQDPIALNHAKAIVRDWIETQGGMGNDTAWDTGIAARRLMAWLNHSITILSIPDYEFHRLFMRSLGMHVRYLKRYAGATNDDFSALLAYLGLSYAAVCFPDMDKLLAGSLERLAQELDRQVKADGSHTSRNPEKTVEMLSFLLPLREGCIATGKEIPDRINASIERQLQALRFFRLGDGNLARFNGSGACEIELLATLMRYSGAGVEGPLNGAIGDYHRLQVGQSVVLMDVGVPPKGELSRQSHAGCLSFEFSSGPDCLVVNCGRPSHNADNRPAYWRATAAHSTAVFYNTSSCKFENNTGNANLLDGQVFGTPLKPDCQRDGENGAHSIVASHTGYAREFGARHERTIELEPDGNRLSGRDWFTGPDKEELYYTTKDAVTVHFHLHPSVKVTLTEDAQTLALETRSGEKWHFSCTGVTPKIVDSIFFAGLTGAQKTKQIALEFNACKTAGVNWLFEKQ